jgi:hypothetical protein
VKASRGKGARPLFGGGWGCFVVLASLIPGLGCGKKGPPLPPLIRVPAAPQLKADRRGSAVELQLTVPTTNTDGSRPANIERVDVYGFTGSPMIPEANLFKFATKVGSVKVKAPQDPNEVVESDECQDEVEPPTGEGLDQGAVAQFEELLGPAALAPTRTGESSRRAAPSPADRPLLGPLAAAPSRTYVGVGVNKNGRRGRSSNRVTVPLAPPPPAPSLPTVEYDEKAVTLTWKPAFTVADQSRDVLPSTPFGVGAASVTYNVYDGKGGALLNSKPVTELRYIDSRVEWGAERCYVVRAVESVGGLTVESDAHEPVCETLVDTFPPAPPESLTALATEGVINLIWDANREKDVDGYLVLRAVASQGEFELVTPEPVHETTFKDAVQPGIRYAYRVQAVDKAGNRSLPSSTVEETAR